MSTYEQYQTAAKKGDAEAQLALGNCYRLGQGVTADEHKAFTWFLKAAKHDGAAGCEAKLIVTMSYYEGRGVKQDKAQAIAWFTEFSLDAEETALEESTINLRDATAGWFLEEAQQGDAAAQTIIGINYFSTNDNQKGLAWLLKAAEQNYIIAQEILGESYLKGIDLPKNPQAGLQWLQKAAAQGSAKAQYELGLAYYEGKGISKDYQEAANCLKQAAAQGYARAKKLLKVLQAQQSEQAQLNIAAEQNDPEAQYQLGKKYDTDDPAKARYWYCQAAKQGHSEAQSILIGSCTYFWTTIIWRETDGERKPFFSWVEPQEAFAWFLALAEVGNAVGQYGIGQYYAEPYLGKPTDEAQAFAWFQKAAAQGYAPAQVKLADCYHLGRGVQQNDQEAFQWFLKAVEGNKAEANAAKFMLSIFYYEGLGVKQDKQQAVQWFLKISDQVNYQAVTDRFLQYAQQGEVAAQTIVGLEYLVYGKNTRSAAIQEQGYDFLLAAAEHGFMVAQEILGKAYIDGKYGLRRDTEQGTYWLKKAIAQGSVVPDRYL